MGSVQQRHRAMPSDTEPLLCRVAAGALPGLRSASCLALPPLPAGKRDCLRRWRRPAAPLAPRSGSAPPRGQNSPPEPRWWRWRSARSPLRGRSATRGPLPPASPLLLRDRRQGIDNSHPAWIQVLTNLASALALRQIRRLTVLTG